MDRNVPDHLAIIVDGNGRWARERGKQRSFGHKAGFERLKDIILCANKKQIKVMSLYVFSTENFKRSEEEVNYLMDLFTNNFKKLIKDYQKENIKVVFSGRKEPLDQKVLNAMEEITVKTQNHTGMIVNFCLNYGGHAEIVDACRSISKQVVDGNLLIEEITEEIFEKNLYQILPPVDLLIRTSGECRLSNFLPWQLAYAEFYFPKVYFPDFTEKEFEEALKIYQNRNRRFGGITYENENH